MLGIKQHFNISHEDTRISQMEAQGRNLAILQCIGRNPAKSFQYWAQYYSLNTLTDPLSRMENILHFQIHAVQQNQLDNLIFQIVPKNTHDHEPIRAFIQNEIISKVLGRDFVSTCAIQFTSIDQLVRNQNSQKVIPFVDHRIKT